MTLYERMLEIESRREERERMNCLHSCYMYGVVEGRRSEFMRILARLIRLAYANPNNPQIQASAEEVLAEFPPEYRAQLEAVLKRYPNYSDEHVGQKMLFECSYLPNLIF